MQQCQEFIRQNFIVGHQTKPAIKATALSAANANGLSPRLSSDAVGYYYSSIVTFADAMRGIQEGFYCWSTVKLYYSAFYSVRSILASNAQCIFYVGKSPYSITCAAGQFPLAGAGATHQAVFSVFNRQFPGHPLLSQEIALQSPIDWLQEMRNDANYRNARFPEPDVPRQLSNIVEHGIRRSLTDYIDDVASLFTFDPSHSMVAFPIEALRVAKAELCDRNNYDLTIQDIAYLSKLVKDRKGVIAIFRQLVGDK